MLYRQDKNRVFIETNEKKIAVTVLAEAMFHIVEYAAEGDIVTRDMSEADKIEYKVTEGAAYLEIAAPKAMLRVDAEGMIDFYDAKGKCISAAYRGERIRPQGISEQERELALQEGHLIEGNRQDDPVQMIRTLDAADCIYGLGDKTGFMNKRGYLYTMWNTDDPMPHEDNYEALYKTIPFLAVLKEDGAYGIFFDNHHKSHFDMGKECPDYYVIGAVGGLMNYYYFGGDTLADVIAGYTNLTGRTPIPQMWTLGYHQSRWGYRTEEEIREVARMMRECEIPCDCIHFDIEYMDNYKVFTWNPDTYKDPKKMLADLKEQGFKAVTIIDPGIKVEKDYEVYEEGMKNGYFVKTPEGEVYTNYVWPGETAFPDFGKKEVRDWWADKHEFLVNLGVDGVWDDMDEPASFQGPLPDDIVFYDEERKTNHAEMHNIYGYNMSRATHEGLKKHNGKRPFVITRACYSGTQKYSTVWTGDNHSIWSHLRLAIPQLCNLGMSGITFAGTDVGGFGSDTTPELLCRWYQVGFLSPLFRNHSTLGSRHQEPWMFGQETMEICRKYIRLRYELLPYIYDCFYRQATDGLPVMRPLVLQYDKDENAKNCNDEFMVGESLLAAPVVEQGARMKMVYLPEGNWVDYWTGELVEGGKYLLREAPLDLCPLYVKAGSILPKYPVRMSVGEDKDDELLLACYPDVDGTCKPYRHYQDNGTDFAYENGEYNLYEFTVDKDGSLKTEVVHGGYKKYEKISRV